MLNEMGEIAEIVLSTSPLESICVGFDGVTKIVARNENGLNGYYTWFDVHEGDVITSSWNGLHVKGVYFRKA